MASPPVDEIRSAAAAFPWVAAVSAARLAAARHGGRHHGPPRRRRRRAGGEAALVSEAGRVLGPVPDRGLRLRLPGAPPAAGYALGASDRAGPPSWRPPRQRPRAGCARLAPDSTGALSARIDGGPVLRLGRPRTCPPRPGRSPWCSPRCPRRTSPRRPTSTCAPVRPAIGGLPPRSRRRAQPPSSEDRGFVAPTAKASTSA